MNRVHIWSDSGGLSASPKGDAEKHAEEHGDQVINVTTVSELKELFKGWLETGESFDYLDFHTHGGPGSIDIGSGYLSLENLDRVYISNVDHIFNVKAKIVFTGCSVAAGHQGEYFLVRFAKMMLKHGGGVVLGSTGAGLADAFISGDVYHPFGSWVSVTVGSGVAQLHGHTHLIPLKIQQRIQSAMQWIAKLQAKSQLPVYEAEKAWKLLNLAIESGAVATYENMFDACNSLSAVESILYKRDPRVNIPRATIKL